MKIWVGLGNPGPKYAGNRHNIGFMAVERIAATHGFGLWRKGFQGQVTDGRLGDERVLLLRPETFMNRSGQAVGEAMRYHKLTPADVTVFHDELDLAPGKLRLKTGGGHAGHNGLRSIHGHIGDAYHRVRLGIGHPGHKDAVVAYVLRDFARADQDWLDDLLRGIADGAPDLARGDGVRFLNAVHARRAPPAPRGKTAGQIIPAGEAGQRADTRSEDPKIASAPAAPTKTPLQRLIERFR